MLWRLLESLLVLFHFICMSIGVHSVELHWIEIIERLLSFTNMQGPAVHICNLGGPNLNFFIKHQNLRCSFVICLSRIVWWHILFCSQRCKLLILWVSFQGRSICLWACFIYAITIVHIYILTTVDQYAWLYVENDYTWLDYQSI